MKNMMYLALLMFLIQIGCFSIGHCRVFLPTDSHLIDQTCRKTPNPTLCVSSLKSDPRSVSADVSGLALIMVDVVKAKVTNTLKKLYTLLKKSPKDKSLKDCAFSYKVVLQVSIPSAIQAITTGNPKFAEQAMNDAANEANSCEDEFSRGSPLTYENKAVSDVAGVASAIVRILL